MRRSAFRPPRTRGPSFGARAAFAATLGSAACVAPTQPSAVVAGASSIAARPPGSNERPAQIALGVVRGEVAEGIGARREQQVEPEASAAGASRGVMAAGPALDLPSVASARCPREMALVAGRVCMDRWEASLERVEPGQVASWSPYAPVDELDAAYRERSLPDAIPQG